MTLFLKDGGYSLDLMCSESCSKKEKLLSSFLVMFRLGLGFKMRFIAISMIPLSGILVKRLVTS